MNDLTTYSLALIVGGNIPNNSKAVATIAGSAPGAMVKDGGVQAVIPADVGQSIQNGYYLCLVGFSFLSWQRPDESRKTG